MTTLRESTHPDPLDDPTRRITARNYSARPIPARLPGPVLHAPWPSAPCDSPSQASNTSAHPIPDDSPALAYFSPRRFSATHTTNRVRGMSNSVFAKYVPKAYPYRFNGMLHVGAIAGGTPTDQKIAEGWLRTKLADNDDLIREAVAEVMAERGVPADEAAAIVSTTKHLNGFKRDEQGLYIEGRQLKAALKEAANVRWPKAKWGPSNKGTLSFFAEHLFVVEDRLHLGVVEPTGIIQRFVHTWRGSSIQYEEYVDDAKVSFTITTDFDFTAEQWALLWLTGEQQGIGASRSQGFGRYEVVAWDKAKA